MGGFRRPGRGGVVSTPSGGYQGNQAGRGVGGVGCNPTPLLEIEIQDLAIWDRRDFLFSQRDFFTRDLKISGEIFPF
jgi:hypothetical protein